MSVQGCGDNNTQDNQKDTDEESRVVSSANAVPRKRSKFYFGDKTDYFAKHSPTKRLEDKGYSVKDKIYPTLVEGLRVSFSELIEPDIDVTICDKIFKCSHMLLSTFSNYFKRVEVGTKEVCLDPKKVPIQAFDFIYKWMRVDYPIIKVNLVLKVYKAAVVLDMPTLVQQVWYHFNNPNLFTEDLAFKFYSSSARMGLSVVKNLMVSRLSKYFLLAVSSEEYLTMPLNDIIQILAADKTAVCNELEIFYSAVRWLNFDFEDRKKNVLKIMECVRFELMPANMLVKLQTGAEKIYSEIVQHEEVAKLVSTALTRSCITIGINTEEEIKALMEELDIERPRPRVWVFDQYSKHHHRPTCNKWRDVTYEVFEKYLSRLQADPKSWYEFRIIDDNNNIPCCSNTLPPLTTM